MNRINANRYKSSYLSNSSCSKYWPMMDDWSLQLPLNDVWIGKVVNPTKFFSSEGI